MSARSKFGLPSLDWEFARQCARAEDLSDLKDLLQLEIERLGFRYFCCCSHVRPDTQGQGAIYLHNYPKPWVEHYNRRKLFARDPIYVIGRTLAQPFLWEDPRFLALIEPDHVQILNEAARHGLKHGATIPLYGPGRASASCSVVSETPDIDPDRVFAVQRFAATAYEHARALVGPNGPDIKMPPREKECLKLAGIGKDDEEIALILAIGPGTVRQYMESVKHRLGVSKRSHAIAFAIHIGLINTEDLFGA